MKHNLLTKQTDNTALQPVGGVKTSKQSMRTTVMTKLFLILSILLWGSNTIGNKNNGWNTEGSKTSAYTIPVNKTLTFTFTVTDYEYAAGTKDFPGYVLNLTRTAATQVGGTAFTFLRSYDMCFYATDWWQGALFNSNTFGEVNKAEFIKGATTEMKIQRYGTQVYIDTKITKDATSYYHYYVQELGTSEDIYAFLCADFATITISGDAITETSSVGSVNLTYGATDNTGGFAASYVGTLAPNQVMNMHFTNYTSGANTYNNWGIELVYNDGENQYFDLIAGNLNRWGSLYGVGVNPVTEITARQGEFANINWPATDDALKNAMAEADVSLTIARSGRVVTIIAVHTPKEGFPFVLKHTLEPKAEFTGFASGNLTVNLITDGSHVTCNNPVQKVNAEVSKYGWSTFSSDYKLDFSGISGLNAYAVTDVDGKTVNTTKVNVADANTGLVLEGTDGENASYFNIPVSTGSAYTGTNLMVAGTGASAAAEANKTKYVLSINGSNQAVFQKIVSTPATVAKGKAYLEGGAGAPTLFFDWSTPTAIESIEAAAEVKYDGVVYNLAGQRVMQPRKGLFIVNGKKIVK